METKKKLLAILKEFPSGSAVNLVSHYKLRDKAIYSGKADENISSEKAFLEFRKQGAGIAKRYGISTIWRGKSMGYVASCERPEWDIIIIQRASSVEHYINALNDPDTDTAFLHRDAASEIYTLEVFADIPAYLNLN